MGSMTKKSGKIQIEIMIAVFFIALFVLLIFINRWLSTQISEMRNEAPIEIQETKVKPQISYKGDILRRTRLDPNRQFSESIFFAGGSEIARFKNQLENIYDFTGEIPDGRVKFINESENTYGEEYYFNNKRNGLYKEFYKTGELRREAAYKDGRLITNKIYFIDGKLRQEEDFSDAMYITNNKEVGKGKIFFRNGTIMYEWSLTNKEKGGYNRSYNQNGELIEENLLNQSGKIIETKRF